MKEIEKLFWQRVDKGLNMVIATSAQDQVTARTVTLIPMNQKLYFPTWRDTTKYQQLKENEHVALASGAIQLTGKIKDVGHPNQAKNRAFSKQFKATFPEGFDDFCKSDEAVVLEITLADILFDQVGTGQMFKGNLATQKFDKLEDTKEVN